MQPAPPDPLSEPPLGRFLRVIRRELAVTVAPEIASVRARQTVEMAASLLDHLVAREEQLAAFCAAQLPAGSAALLTLQAMLGVDPSVPPGASSADAGESWCATAADLEYAIAELVPRLPGLAPKQRRAAWAAIAGAIDSEAALHDGLEQAEREVAAGCALAEESALPEPDAARLAAYLNARAGTGHAIEVRHIEKVLGGYSKDTFIVELAGSGRPADAIVLRRDLAHGPLEGSVAQEFAVLAAMHEAGVAVPRPLWVESGTNVLGAPVIVTERVPGKQIVDLNFDVIGAGSAERVLQLARMLARIHAVDPQRAGISAAELEKPVREHILALLEQFEQQWQRRRLGPSPTIAAGFAWMKSHVPEDLPAAVIVHGDPTLRNVLFEGARATALLDWETWHLGDPGEDLAYCRMDVERFVPWADFLREYHAHGGKPFGVASERYWSMWNCLRGAVTSVSMMDRLLIDPPPDIRPAFGGPYYVRMLTRKVGEQLRKFSDEESDASE